MPLKFGRPSGILGRLFLLCSACCAQTLPSRYYDTNFHVWTSYAGDHQIKGSWGLHFDGQWRRSDFGTAWQQYQLRPGVNLRVSEKVLVTAGYVFTRGYPYGDNPVRDAFPENRIYEQALVRHVVKDIRLHHRFRLEQRFIRYPVPQPLSWTYQNRFRYSLKSDFPLTRADDSGRRWYLPVYNEVILGIAPNYGARPWDQNRFFVGIGRSYFRTTNVEFGYLNQFLGQRNGRVFEVNHTVFLTVACSKKLSELFR